MPPNGWFLLFVKPAEESLCLLLCTKRRKIEIMPDPNPDETYAKEIDDKQQFMRHEVDKTLRDKLQTGRELLTIDSGTSFSDEFIGTRALMRVFEEFDVVDAYYTATAEAEEASEPDGSWEASLRAPHRPKALFVIKYVFINSVNRAINEPEAALANGLLVAASEGTTAEDIDALGTALEEVLA